MKKLCLILLLGIFLGLLYKALSLTGKTHQLDHLTSIPSSNSELNLPIQTSPQLIRDHNAPEREPKAPQEALRKKHLGWLANWPQTEADL